MIIFSCVQYLYSISYLKKEEGDFGGRIPHILSRTSLLTLPSGYVNFLRTIFD